MRRREQGQQPSDWRAQIDSWRMKAYANTSARLALVNGTQHAVLRAKPSCINVRLLHMGTKPVAALVLRTRLSRHYVDHTCLFRANGLHRMFLTKIPDIGGVSRGPPWMRHRRCASRIHMPAGTCLLAGIFARRTSYLIAAVSAAGRERRPLPSGDCSAAADPEGACVPQQRHSRVAVVRQCRDLHKPGNCTPAGRRRRGRHKKTVGRQR